MTVYTHNPQHITALAKDGYALCAVTRTEMPDQRLILIAGDGQVTHLIDVGYKTLMATWSGLLAQRLGTLVPDDQRPYTPITNLADRVHACVRLDALENTRATRLRAGAALAVTVLGTEVSLHTKCLADAETSARLLLNLKED